MFTHERTLYRFNLSMVQLIAADIPDDELRLVPFPGANPPAWILGHLAICTDFAARLLGLGRECPRAWHAMFGPGSKPAELGDNVPSKAELLAALVAGHARVTEAARTADPAAMQQPQTVEVLKGTPLETIGDVLAHLMCTHESFHIAQLSACRRKLGKAPLI
ncbi:MAG: DinB family protein [Pirellulales bacterium]|nr:DinB family protein [Pirellulales bacterium]